MSSVEEHPSTLRSRLLCLIGRHDWRVGRHVTYCRRCYASR